MNTPEPARAVLSDELAAAIISLSDETEAEMARPGANREQVDLYRTVALDLVCEAARQLTGEAQGASG